MCWMCDNPSATVADARARAVGIIDRVGWLVQGVEAEEFHGPWAYTVGLSAHDLPEFVVHDLELDRAAALLDAVAEDHLDGGVRFQVGDHLHDGEGWFQVRDVPRACDELLIAVDFFGRRIRALELVAVER